jgi:hypothetical protein
MPGRLDHHFMGADAIHLVIDPVPFPIQIALDSESRKLIGHDPKAPARGIGKAPVISKGDNLGGSLILIPLAERTKTTGRFSFLRGKIGGPSSSLR